MEWFGGVLVHTDGLWAGVPFTLTDWQEHDIIRPLFGWQRWSTQWKRWVRRYSRASIWIPRGNGKTELAAGVVLFLLTADGEESARVYGAAEDRDQAAEVFEPAARMVRLSPVLRRMLQAKELQVVDSTKRIIHHPTGSYYRALPRDDMGEGSQGFRVHGAIVDEYHVQKTKALVDALRKGMGKRVQPLFVTISTAGTTEKTPAGEDYAYAKKVQAGEYDDPNLFVYIREADEGDDPFDEATWHKANPALGDFLALDMLRQEAREAKAKPSELNDFLRFRLNIWTRQVTRYIPMDAWDSTAGMVVEEQMLARHCVAGLDVGSQQGMTALVLAFPGDDGHIDLLCRFFMPEDDLVDREFRDRLPYRQWAKEGFLDLTSGATTDYATIREAVMDAARLFDLESVAYRPVGATQVVGELLEEGLTMVEIRSTPAKMHDGTTALLDLVIDGKLRHGGNPVLRAQADVLAVKRDADGNIKPDQSSSAGLIPGILALVRALNLTVQPAGRSVYEDYGPAFI